MVCTYVKLKYDIFSILLIAILVFGSEGLRNGISMKYLYIMISQTQTGYARLIRKVGKVHFNHASISLDEGLQQMYAFARTEQYGYLTASLVHETTDRYLVNSQSGVPIKLFRIPVTDEQYDSAKARIMEILSDPEYKYNLMSVLTFPVLKGFSTYKSYSCIEFVMHVLEQAVGMKIDKPVYRYKPDDLELFLKDYEYYEGNLLDYSSEYTKSEGYFNGVSLKLVRKSASSFLSIAYRTAVVACIGVLSKLSELPIEEFFEL